ncbi:Daunorubicin/doxorubicin resistance ATP-binding protein DrrA [Dermatophilus congolensis]|uniref:Daunorubicin/doxorubicin resistance ATP-binding protein DrrA n=4 Tax=Dermatophilus congolensis TaxID=1863 RepID=A0A239V5L5_9MICO|nr:Daunorubicin/doxorubicin resistance ATP-binding protein DrrA [Dermatophilus congolensis]
MWAGTMASPRPIDEALALVDMLDRREVLVQSLSGGERRRLDLALAIMGRPRLLFLDEPTTGLDPESRHRAWDVLTRLVDGGTSVVLTTHYLEEAERLADRIAIMHAGQIAATGTLAQIVADQPATITFRTPAVAVPQFAGVHMSVDGPRTVLRTHALQPDLARLLAWAGEDIVLEDLRASAASLEQTFLTIAGSASSPLHEEAA